MNQHVPDWNLEDESRYYNDILPKADETKPMGELIELLWQDGHVVMHSQNLQKASAITGEFKPVQEPEPAQRCEKPLGSSINLIQDNESLSWFQNPLDDSLEKEFCSEFFSEMAGIDAAGLNKRNNNVIAEDEKFVKFGATNKSNVFTDSAPHQATLHLQDNIMPPPKLQGSKRPASCLENGNALNFSHFSRSLRGKLREKGSGSGTKVGGQGSTMMTVGSSICGSNPIHSHADLSSDVDGVAGGPNEGAQIWLPSESVRKQVYETTLASSSGGSGFSVRRIGEQGDSNQCHKRKERDVEGLEYQSEEAEYESSEGKKPAQGSISTRRSRAAEVHNLSERRRRDRINEKMKALQELIPHCNKTDKASMLDEAIEYLKSLQLQVQMMWMGSGMAHMMFPGIQQYMSGMGMGIARAPVPSMHHTVRLPSVPVVDQSVGSSSTTNQTLFCPSSAFHAVDFGNLMRSAHLQESYAPYLGFHYLQSHSQAMNLCAFGSHIAQQNQASAAPSSFTLPSAGQAPNCENNHEGESG